MSPSVTGKKTIKKSMKSSLSSCQCKSKLAKELAWVVFVRDDSPPGHMPGIYLEIMKTWEKLTWVYLNIPSFFKSVSKRSTAKGFDEAQEILWASHT
jgi:hypothetical protein